MSKMTSSRVSDDLETLFGAGALGHLSDAELLARFLVRDEAAGSEAAFSEILARHGPMVMGVCKRVLADSQIAVDAFQAVFLVLVRKAPEVRVGDSLGRWLYGVSVRVARRARRNAIVARGRERNLGGFDRAGGSLPSEASERADLHAVIDEEIARLPGRYRSAVVFCYLEGMTQEQAARRLCCPVGTVESRLHRARQRLRSSLARRGLAPSVGLSMWLSDGTARAYVPAGLAMETTAAAVRWSIDGSLGSAVSAAVQSLVNKTMGIMMMVNGFRVGLLVLAIGLPTAAAFGLSRADDEEAKKGDAADPIGLAKGSGRAAPTLADQFARIKAEYDAQQQAVWRALETTKSQREVNAVYAKMSPDEVAYTRRMIDLALSAVKDPAARDALVWVVNKPGMFKMGEYGDEFARAVELLVRHHGDDPEAVRIGLSVDNIVSHHSDALVTGFYAAAKGHEAKGLARLALAQYLEEAANFSAATRRMQGRQTNRFVGVIGDDGKPHDKEVEQSDEEYAYVVQLRLRDPDAMRALAERLFSEVIAEYGDVVHRTVKHRELKALLESPEPKWNGKPLTPDELGKLKGLVESKRTLADEAQARLDKMHNLIAGKPAPEISGVGFDGKPLKLSDYRGKVVALVFWGTWCGPCMREVPHERELAERLKGKPFALLGVNCDDDEQAAASAIKEERMTWPNWHDGAPGEGPIARRYHIRSYPTIFVIDGRGIIRHTQLLGESLDKAVDELLKETKPVGGGG
jgi:RNA polymerase sigma factor (sigma-70 family)